VALGRTPPLRALACIRMSAFCPCRLHPPVRRCRSYCSQYVRKSNILARGIPSCLSGLQARLHSSQNVGLSHMLTMTGHHPQMA